MCTMPHVAGNYSFRRTFKHIKKTALRGDKAVIHASVEEHLADYGLAGNFYDLLHALKHNVKGRYYYRLGQAALRKKSLVSLVQITFCVIHRRDLREVEFIKIP